jgi:hypothetical protein
LEGLKERFLKRVMKSMEEEADEEEPEPEGAFVVVGGWEEKEDVGCC